MAVKNILVDDIDQATEATDTIPYSYRGKQYEIDLAPENVQRFDETMSQWIDVSRVITGGGGGKKQATPTKKTAVNGNGRSNGNTDTDKAEYYASVREWARANGRQVHDRGRLPADVITSYEEANAAAKK